MSSFADYRAEAAYGDAWSTGSDCNLLGDVKGGVGDDSGGQDGEGSDGELHFD